MSSLFRIDRLLS